MMLSEVIAPSLPLLRRYSRAVTGSQKAGDAGVARLLELLIADPDRFPTHLDARTALYQMYHSLVLDDSEPADGQDETVSGVERVAAKRLSALMPNARWALLLTTLEGFSQEHAAVILGRQPIEIRGLVDNAISAFDRQTRISVLIIEDEPIIALDLEQIVRGLGHHVVGPVDNRSEAVQAFRRDRPGLVLADIQLADGSSGIDAVNDILGDVAVPVIFITAFPERLLTGERPEPTFLITKPFQIDTVKATISQALFFEQAAERRA